MTSEGGGFLGRWSRRKQAERESSAVEDAAPRTPELPPIEALGAASDYTAFLQKGVSALVQAQALHRAWTSDAAISEFRGMADYDWDFNATGYGRMWAGDDVAALLRSVMGTTAAEPVAETEAEGPGPATADAPTVRLSAPEPAVVVAATEDAPADEAASRRHGSAKPA